MSSDHFIQQKSIWVTKDNLDFDVTTGSFDGAKNSDVVGLYFLGNSDVVGLYFLGTLRKEFSDKNGLCRNDGLSCFQVLLDLTLEEIKKKKWRIFKQYELNITV